MHDSGVRIVVTSFNSYDRDGSKQLMDKAQQLQMIVFAGYSNQTGRGIVFPAGDSRSVSVVDTARGQNALAFEAASVGIKFAIDVSVPLDSYGPSVDHGSSYASAKAAAYALFYLRWDGSIGQSDIELKLRATASTRKFESSGLSNEMPFIGQSRMTEAFIADIATSASSVVVGSAGTYPPALLKQCLRASDSHCP